MVGTLFVQWTVTPKFTPQPLRACNRCGAVTPFRSSGKIRLNANRKRIDAWLIYRCTACDKTWNRPIFERRNIQEIDPGLLQTLQSNDGEWARSFAFDIDSLRRHAWDVREFPDVDLRKQVLSEGRKPWSELRILFNVPMPVSVRTDRILAATLNLSRTRIQSLERSGRLRLFDRKKRKLRHPVTDRMHVSVDLSDLGDGLDICLAARNPEEEAGRQFGHVVPTDV